LPAAASQERPRGLSHQEIPIDMIGDVSTSRQVEMIT
jgi:hypothetical protein